MFRSIWFASSTQLLLLYSVIMITFIYLLIKYKNRSFYILVILFFYPALFDYLGKNFLDGYKIIVLLLTIWISINRNVFSKQWKGDHLIIFLFLLFCISFASSSIINNENWTIILSQLSRYVIVFCLWFIIRYELYFRQENIVLFSRFTFDLILMQIIISLAKLFIFKGQQLESIVGSISFTGGASGTTLPILGFIVLWFHKQGVFRRKNWLYVIGLMLIGFLAGKRAVWFIMPIVIAGFMFYLPGVKINSKILVAILMIPTLFYFGVRLTPTLNPENKVWGSFDYNYSFSYAKEYQFGDKTRNNQNNSHGRGGATISLWKKWASGELFTVNDWFGIGLSKMYGTDYDEFDELETGINFKGAASGVFQTYITTGYLGILATVLFFFVLLWHVKMKRIRWLLIIIVAWEYFFYTGIIFRTPAFMFLIVYFIHYANYLTIRSQRIDMLTVL